MYFQKCLPESLVNAHNERIVRRGLSVIRSSAADDHDDNSDGGATANTVDQQVGATANQPNQASLLIDPTCVPLDIRHPTDLSLLNEARELTETLIDAMHLQVRESFGHKPRTHGKQARQQFLAVALAEGFCKAVEEAPPNQQDPQSDQAAAWSYQALWTASAA